MYSAVHYVTLSLGRAEAIRTLLVDNNVEYEEADVGPRDNWVNNWKPKMVCLCTQQVHTKL